MENSITRNSRLYTFMTNTKAICSNKLWIRTLSTLSMFISLPSLCASAEGGRVVCHRGLHNTFSYRQLRRFYHYFISICDSVSLTMCLVSYDVRLTMHTVRRPPPPCRTLTPATRHPVSVATSHRRPTSPTDRPTGASVSVTSSVRWYQPDRILRWRVRVCIE